MGWDVGVCADDKPEGLCITGDGAGALAAPVPPATISTVDDRGDSGTPSTRRRFRDWGRSEVAREPEAGAAPVGVAGAANI